MKRILPLFALLLLNSCDPPSKKYVLETKEKQAAPFTDPEKMEEINMLKEPVTESWFTESAQVKGRVYTACSGNNRVFVLNARKDTIFRLNGSGEARFLDFNHDGYKDLYIGYMTNVPDINDLALFDTLSGTFRLVQQFSDFPASQKIPGINCYYSYHKSGCADMDWGSELFYIKDYKTHLIGRIEGLGCENDPKQGVFVYKVIGKKERLTRSFLISTLAKYKDYKWGFIADYWQKNHHLFVPENNADSLKIP